MIQDNDALVTSREMWREIEVYEVEESFYEEEFSFCQYRYFFFDDKKEAEDFVKKSIDRHIHRKMQVLHHTETNKLYHIPQDPIMGIASLYRETHDV